MISTDLTFFGDMYSKYYIKFIFIYFAFCSRILSFAQLKSINIPFNATSRLYPLLVSPSLICLQVWLASMVAQIKYETAVVNRHLIGPLIKEIATLSK